MTFFLILLAVVLLVLEIRSLRIPLSKLEYASNVSKKNIEQGEWFTVNSIYTNKTGRRIPFVCSEEFMSPAIELESLNRINSDSTQIYNEDAREHKRTYSIYMKKNERVTHSEQARCLRRGIFQISTCLLNVGDFLGLKEQQTRKYANTWVAVYPRRLKDVRLDNLVKGIMGDISVRSFIFEDPMLVRGYKDYSGTEPFRAISFQQSAKIGRLVVREFDHTREATVDLVFDADFKGNIDSFFTRIETCFSLARSISETLTNKGIKVRLITNLCCADTSESELTVIDGDYNRILQFLTAASRATTCKYQVFLTYLEKEFASTDASLIYLAQEPNSETLNGLETLHKKYGIATHAIWGSDYEEAYNDSKIL